MIINNNNNNLLLLLLFSPEETWLKTEIFYVNGKEVVHKQGEPVPENLARSLRAIRREAPEFWALLEKLRFQFYQQPAGFYY